MEWFDDLVLFGCRMHKKKDEKATEACMRVLCMRKGRCVHHGIIKVF